MKQKTKEQKYELKKKQDTLIFLIAKLKSKFKKEIHAINQEIKALEKMSEQTLTEEDEQSLADTRKMVVSLLNGGKII